MNQFDDTPCWSYINKKKLTCGSYYKYVNNNR